jgi:erythromycin esterase-like protein
MNLPKARNGSWEHMLHQISPADKIILSSELGQLESLKNPIGHRAIGVVYDPSNERGNYVPSIIPKRYDAFIYIDKTRALRPIK